MKKIKKFVGVYYNTSKEKRHQGKPNKCYYITFRDQNKKFVWEKVGWASEGYTAQMASNVRGERLRDLRHGKELPKDRKTDLQMKEAWTHYDKWIEKGKKHPEGDMVRMCVCR